MNKLVISRSHWEKSKAHLLKMNGEHFVFFLCGVAKFDDDGVSFFVQDVIPIQDTDIQQAKGKGLQLSLEALLRITNRARKEGLALVEAHSHPWVKTSVRFTKTDLDGLKEFVPYILDDLPSEPYAATVWGQESVDGLCWRSSTKNQIPLEEVRIVGENITRIITTSTLKKLRTRSKDGLDDRASRQVHPYLHIQI